jgi:hypothetical protein
MRVQVLSDQAQRNVYDVYGKKGLKAGRAVVPVRPLREQWLMYQQQRWTQDRYDLLVQSSDITISCNATEAVSCVLRGVQPEVWPLITGVGVDSVMRLNHSDTVMGLVGCALLCHCSHSCSCNGKETPCRALKVK